jgi:GT2 family glycosyltransferase
MPIQLPLSVAIPTYRRGPVLLSTIEYLLALQPPAAEILILDQTESHSLDTESRLQQLAEYGLVRWLRLPAPSITAAMNEGLRHAVQDVILFVDDDVRPEPELLRAHATAQQTHLDGLVAGRVIQPWQENIDFSAGGCFHFASTRAALVREFMGGNFSIRRDLAIRLGGFDENFVRVAYRFEAEFAHRYCADGRQILFEPRACVHHLKANAGGTRSYGEHLTTWRPDHAVGAYYYGLRTHNIREFLARPFRAIASRYHLRHPWRIPGTLLAELTGMCWAFGLFLRGPRRLQSGTGKDGA